MCLYSAAAFGKSSPRDVIWEITSASAVWRRQHPGETVRNVSVFKAAKGACRSFQGQLAGTRRRQERSGGLGEMMSRRRRRVRVMSMEVRVSRLC